MRLSVLFFGADAAGASDGYHSVLEVVRLADRLDFVAAWFPERHFTAFGGGYPSPVVLAGAVATNTERLRLRAGSLIVPLHDPVRVAEDWAVVDNLSHGRVELSFGSGWNVNDFVLAPDVYQERRSVMAERMAVVRQLWRGEPVSRVNGVGQLIEVRTLPRPVQPELPVWLTAQSDATFAYGGEQGYPVLTNLNFNARNQLADRITAYREANRRSGHGAGHVALMVHTFVGGSTASVRAVAEPALRNYLNANLELRSEFAAGKLGSTVANLVTAEQRDAIISRGIDRLFDWAAVLGTPADCARRIREFADAGVDELACLVDFGPPLTETLDSLELLAGLLKNC